VRAAFSRKQDEKKHLLGISVWQMAHIFGKWLTNLAKLSTVVW